MLSCLELLYDTQTLDIQCNGTNQQYTSNSWVEMKVILHHNTK